MKLKIWNIILFLVIALSSHSQNIVCLNRSAFPVHSYTKRYQEPFEHDSIPDKQGFYREIEKYKVLAGDYSDSVVKFSIALNTFQDPNDKSARKTDTDYYQLYVAPYKADSIYIYPCNPFKAKVQPLKPFIISIGKKEYQCILAKDIKKITITPFSGKWVFTYFNMYNDSLPNDSILLIDGKINTFREYENKNKFIYVFIWTATTETALKKTHN